MSKTIVFRDEQGEHRAVIADDGSVRIGEGAPVRVRPASDGAVRVDDDPRPAWTAVDGDTRWVYFDGRVFRFEASQGPARRKSGAHHGSLTAPMPATVVRVEVTPGDAVKRGDTLIILEAMKMELPVRAPADGVVTSVNCRAGELVQPGVGLLEIDTSDSRQ